MKTRIFLFIAALALCLTAALAGTPAGAPAGNVSQSALDQIGALLAEKASWTPVQAKLDSELIHALKNHRGEAFAAGAPSLRLGVEMQPDGRVLVDINAKVNADLLSLINQGGGRVVNSFPQFDAVRAMVTLDQLETLAGVPEVSFIQRAVRATTNAGSVDSQGDVTHLAGVARTAFGVGGAGIKVGVISDSVDYLAIAQATGDLGSVTVLPGQSGVPGAGEGTAMLEIVHDLAPAAPLYFATAFASEASFAYNILDLWSNGCNVIIDDVFYFDESPFQDGILARAVNTVTAGGALFFSAAGNSGSLDAGNSGTWEGDFVDGGAAGPPIPEAARLHSFGPATYNTVTNPAAFGRIDLFWSDPLGASANDYDVFLLDSNGVSVVASSMNRQTGTQNPYEEIYGVTAGERIVIVKYSGVARFLHLASRTEVHRQFSQLSICTAGATVGHSAATNAFSVAATPAAAPVEGEPAGPFPSPFNSGNVVEFFTSDGPRQVFYNADGSAITPGNLLHTGGAIRQKPDITAANGVVTTLPSSSGLNPFYGTSAASPHAGAIAALIWSYNPALTTDQIRSLLTSTAIDIGPAGWDRDSGWGIVMAYPALTNLSGTAPPGINLQPADQTVPVGGTANFSVTAVGVPPFSYSWQRNGSPIAGATDSTYATNNVQLGDSGSQFSCVVSNTQAVMTSSNGTLTILGAPPNDLCSGATIITSANYTNVESTVTATTTGDRVPSCSYGFTNGVWYQYTPPSDGQLVVDVVASDFPADLVLYTGTCGSLTEVACASGYYNPAQPITYTVSGGVVYRILAGGDGGAAGNLVFHLAFTSFSGPPNILTQPANETVPAGASPSFSISVLGSPPLNYFWSRNGAFIAGATNSSYAAINVQLSDSGAQFSCVVSNAFGITNSASALLDVFTGVPAATVAYVRSTAQFPFEPTDKEGILTMVFGSGWQDLRYETVYPSALFSSALRFIFIEGGGENEPAMASFLNANMSAVTAWVAAGGSLFIDSAPYFYGTNFSVNLGFGATLNVESSAYEATAPNPAHPIFSGPYVPVGSIFYGGVGSATVTGTGLSPLLLNQIDNNSLLSEGSYAAGHLLFGGTTLPEFLPQPQASNLLANILLYAAKLGSSSNNLPPVIFAPPADLTGEVGAPATFSLSAGGAPPLSYFWSRNGAYIAGATNSAYTLNSVQGSDTGAQFSCLVTNAYGSMTSSKATLSVELVRNGGFETGNFTNWTHFGNIVSDFVTYGPPYAHSGSYGAALGPAGSLGYLSQTLPTTAGQTYLLSLWLLSPDGLTPNQFEVFWHNALLYNRFNLPAAPWTNLQFLVTATASSTVLEFGFRDDPSFGLGLDDISVMPVLPPVFQSVGESGNAIIFSWRAQAGLSYQVQYAAVLQPPDWTNLSNRITATNSTLTLSDPIVPGGTSRRFYRVVVLP